MAKRATLTKRLTPENLSRIGADRLAALLVEMAEDSAIWKRRLRMELAGEIGPEDLSAEIDKRLTSIASSRGRVSWRKRPELLRDLDSVRRMIVGPLAAADPPGGFARLLMWLALFPGLERRVKDPKGEMLADFLAASQDLETLSEAARQGGAPADRLLADLIAAQPGPWARWLGEGGGSIGQELAAQVLSRIRAGAPELASRAVFRRLAELANDVDAWLDALTPAQRADPDTAADLAGRLVAAGRLADARRVLDEADPGKVRPKGWAIGRSRAPAPASEAWELARIAVLEAEGDAAGAQAARWSLFERGLSPEPLRDFVARLPDFEDVEALERAFAVALVHPQPVRALRFLMEWPALREAASLVERRGGELGPFPQAAEYAARLEQRYPDAAALLARRAF